MPLTSQARGALERLSRRENFVSPNDLVVCAALDESALRRRYRPAQAVAGVRPLRFHDLRHTFGSQLASRGIDLVTLKEAMGHASGKWIAASAMAARMSCARSSSIRARKYVLARPRASSSSRCGQTAASNFRLDERQEDQGWRALRPTGDAREQGARVDQKPPHLLSALVHHGRLFVHRTDAERKRVLLIQVEALPAPL
ncbi:MAG: tyrosine-type recombinase/integrase [Solirubrobacteraceae bacterium]